MDDDREKAELEVQLVMCRRLADEFTDGITAENLCELAEELEQRIRQLKNAHG
jgi:hypothetical protein